MTSADIIRTLQLKPHPEGGHYKETYRSRIRTGLNGNARNVCTVIYYLLQNDERSAFHRIKSDELWFFHSGVPLEILYIAKGNLEYITLGADIDKGETPQVVIPSGTWFAARVKGGEGYALVSCTVAPGFEFKDFELAKRAVLLEEFPHLGDVIEEFTRS